MAAPAIPGLTDRFVNVVSRLAGRAIEGGPADLGHGTNIIDRQMIGIAGGEEFQRMSETFVIGRVGPGTSLVDPTGFGRGNAFELTFLDQIGLKFGNPGQHRDEELANRGGRVDHIPAHIQDDERHPPLCQDRHGIEGILRTAGKAVQFRDHDRVIDREAI